MTQIVEKEKASGARHAQETAWWFRWCMTPLVVGIFTSVAFPGILRCCYPEKRALLAVRL
jgi:hypothetical protein